MARRGGLLATILGKNVNQRRQISPTLINRYGHRFMNSLYSKVQPQATVSRQVFLNFEKRVNKVLDCGRAGCTYQHLVYPGKAYIAPNSFADWMLIFNTARAYLPKFCVRIPRTNPSVLNQWCMASLL